jgi:hypothetical protein
MKAKNNPRPTADDICQYKLPDGSICGRPYAHLHEVFFGTGQRQKSIQWRMQIRLCHEHHEDPSSKENPHYNAEIDMKYKQEFQEKFERDLINFKAFLPEEAHEMFYREFKKHYI